MGMSQVTLYNLTEIEICNVQDRYGVGLLGSRTVGRNKVEHTFGGNPNDVENLYYDTHDDMAGSGCGL